MGHGTADDVGHSAAGDVGHGAAGDVRCGAASEVGHGTAGDVRCGAASEVAQLRVPTVLKWRFYSGMRRFIKREVGHLYCCPGSGRFVSEIM